MSAVPQSSFGDLYRAHGARIRRLCRLLLADSDEAADVSQDILMKLAREQDTGLARHDWNAWITRVTVNACRDHRRSGWWRRWRSGGLELRADELAAPSATPEEAVVALETRRQIWASFRRLSPRQREVFVLRHVDGLSTAEVSAALGLAEGSTKRHLFRAVRQLREALGAMR